MNSKTILNNPYKTLSYGYNKPFKGIRPLRIWWNSSVPSYDVLNSAEARAEAKVMRSPYIISSSQK